jgi:hypothetical protein
MREIKNFFYATGIKHCSKNEEVIGLPIPLKGEMAIIRHEDLEKIDLLYKGEIQIPIQRIRQSSFKFLSQEAMDELLRRFENA